ncbi:hypothetical protein [Hymenobacter psoromatis]|uniref:hypothetical protein n=1 Tax=Hymenobacter psoromatis TaxID=1484116 RepID=UPI001CBE2F18|nr:hypothetical protein [Hymenobacter psoromatis]
MPTDSALPELLHLTYRVDLAVLIGRWGYQAAEAELPAEYARLEAAALAHEARHWLQDIRRRSLNYPDTSRWLLSEFFPGMARRLGGQLRVAYLVSPALQAHIYAEPSFVPLAAYAGRPFAVGFFGDEGAAIEWLLSP